MRSLLFALALAPLPVGVPAPHRLRAGDVLTIAVTGAPYGGEYQVLDDGAIYGAGFGRVTVAGKTWEEAQSVIRVALSRFVRPREVMLSLHAQRPDCVYLIGPAGKGEIPFRPSLTLRQLIASTPVDGEADLTDVQLFRAGCAPQSFGLAGLVAKESAEDPTLQPNDVITLTPRPFLRVWVTGSVKSPGLTRVPAGVDAYQAVILAGGFAADQNAADPTENDTLCVRRGDQTFELPGHPLKGTPQITVQPGDSLVVEPCGTIRFTILGEVAHPSEFTMRGKPDLLRAMTTAGGATHEGMLSGVMMVRNGDLTRYDLSGMRDGRTMPSVPMAMGDLVVVAKNERSFYVFGEVGHPGKIPMDEDKTYRLTDALADGGGITPRGVLRRISLARPGLDGKYVVTQYNLDEFLRDGKTSQNPELQPGDMVLFTTSRGVTFGTAMQAMSAAFLLQNVAGVAK